MRNLRWRLFLHSLLLCLAVQCLACNVPGPVQFVRGQCLIDGHPATIAEVGVQQSVVTRRVQSRQPVFVLITILVVVLAGASHAEKLVLLFSTRGAHAQGLGERLRMALDRYRAHPVRYFAIVSGTLGLLLITGAVYIYLDADKRASERALGQLQFCHLALRTAEEKRDLDEQRRNLETIQATAGDIRTLVNMLPPAERGHAKEIVDHLGMALNEQGKLVGQYAHHSDEAARMLRDGLRDSTEALQKGIHTLSSDIEPLKGIPTGIHDLGEQLHHLDSGLKALDGKLGEQGGRLASSDARLGAQEAHLQELAAGMKTLLGRPACPPCSCAPPRPAEDVKPAKPAKAEP